MIIYGEPSIGLLITIVIVVSIFIGVGIKNWLEDRKDKIKIELANACVETEKFLNKQIEATYKVVVELNKAKEIIKMFVNECKMCRAYPEAEKVWDKEIAEAEQFIKE